MKLLIAILIFAGANALADDPHLANPYVGDCDTSARKYVSSSEYENRKAEIIGACADVDAKCVEVAGDSMSDDERSSITTFLPVIRACKGRGKGECLQQIFTTVSSFERRTAKDVLKLLKKCN